MKPTVIGRTPNKYELQEAGNKRLLIHSSLIGIRFDRGRSSKNLNKIQRKKPRKTTREKIYILPA